MNGSQFLHSLIIFYNNEDLVLYDQYAFVRWLHKRDGTISFQFSGCIPKKSIPQIWLTRAKDQLNDGINIDRNWFRENFHANDCRVSVALWLLNNH